MINSFELLFLFTRSTNAKPDSHLVRNVRNHVRSLWTGNAFCSIRERFTLSHTRARAQLWNLSFGPKPKQIPNLLVYLNAFLIRGRARACLACVRVTVTGIAADYFSGLPALAVATRRPIREEIFDCPMPTIRFIRFGRRGKRGKLMPVVADSRLHSSTHTERDTWRKFSLSCWLHSRRHTNLRLFKFRNRK